MRTSRIKGSVILAGAKLRRAALASADLRSCKGWPSEFEASFGDRTSPRLEKRLFASLTERNGDPAMLEADARRLIAMADDQRHMAAVAAGLIYHLPAMGTVMDRQVMNALASRFGEFPLSIALSHAHLSPKSVTLLDVLDEGLRHFVEADGWAILDLWAAEQGLARIWRGWNGKTTGGSVSLVATAALAIALAVIRHRGFSEGEA
jgi:hypothetical protein